MLCQSERLPSITVYFAIVSDIFCFSCGGFLHACAPLLRLTWHYLVSHFPCYSFSSIYLPLFWSAQLASQSPFRSLLQSSVHFSNDSLAILFRRLYRFSRPCMRFKLSQFVSRSKRICRIYFCRIIIASASESSERECCVCVYCVCVCGNW